MLYQYAFTLYDWRLAAAIGIVLLALGILFVTVHRFVSSRECAAMDSVFLRFGRGLVAATAVFWLVFLVAPIAVTLVASFTSSTYLTFPPPGYSFKWYISAFEASWMWSTLWNSVIIAVVSTAAAVVLGIAAARVLARHRFYGRGLFEYAVLSRSSFRRRRRFRPAQRLGPDRVPG